MDIDILLALQNFRNGVGGVLADFMAKMTFLGEINSALVIMAVVYWCVHKEFGSYLMMGWSGNRLVNGVLKVTACAYRPWIRDARIVPFGNATTTATGYSFPSGHTTNAATVFGGIALDKKIPKLMRWLSGITLVLVGLSRCFLGVHTPQDVVVGGLAGLLVMWVTYRLMQWVAEDSSKDLIVAGIGLALAVAVALYAGLKLYPADYDETGKLLVDGTKMASDTFKGASYCAGFLVGWILERRFVGFSTDIEMPTRLTRLIAGVLSYYAVDLILAPLLKGWIPGTAGTVVSGFIKVFYLTFVFPWFMNMIERKRQHAV